MNYSPDSPTRQRIIDSARQIIKEGDMNPSMSDIAARARVSKSALYYFFRNKKDILVQTMRMVPAANKDIILKADRKKVGAEYKLREILETFCNSIEREDSVSQLLVRQVFAHDKEVLRTVVGERHVAIETLTKIIEQGVKEGVFREVDPKSAAEIVGGYLDYLVMALTLPLGSRDMQVDCDPVKKCEQLYRMILK